jgi:hypothetical protein
MSDETTTIYCANHPNVETSLRCNRCNKPICVKCAVSTPTGYRCKECIRGLQKVYETAIWYDYVFAVIISGVLSYIGSQILPSLGFFSLFLSPVAGVIIAEAVRLAVRKRRSRGLFLAAAGAAAIGSLPLVLITLASVIIFLSQGGLGILWGLAWQVVYTFIVTSTVYYRLSGISLRA